MIVLAIMADRAHSGSPPEQIELNHDANMFFLFICSIVFSSMLKKYFIRKFITVLNNL